MLMTFDKLLDQMEEEYFAYDNPFAAQAFIDGEIYALYVCGHISLEEYNDGTAKNYSLFELHKNDNNDD